MKVFVCVDDQMGRMFNHRRQSQDRVLREYLLHKCGEKPLWMNAYSAKQFASHEGANIRVDEEFLAHAGAEDFCFTEDLPLLPYRDRISQLVLCKWNRVYPTDCSLDLLPEENGFHLCSAEEFAGSSHEKITVEVYEK